MIPRYLYIINDPPCNSAYAAKRLNKRSLLLLLLLNFNKGWWGGSQAQDRNKQASRAKIRYSVSTSFASGCNFVVLVFFSFCENK